MMINRQILTGLRTAGMDRDQAEVIATYIPDWSQFATKADLEDLRIATKADIRNLQAETKADIQNLRAETKADIQNLQAETKADIQNLRAETKADIHELRVELARVGGRLTGLYWLVGTFGVILSILQGMPFLVQLF